MKIKLYLDEDIQLTIAKGLREKGYDVWATAEVGRKSSSDDDQLEYAISQKRAIVSYYKGHFAQCHYRYMSNQLEHYSITSQIFVFCAKEFLTQIN